MRYGKKELAPTIQLLHHFESCVLYPYKDPVGLWTIGWGHLIKKGEKFPAKISQSQADAIFWQDFQYALSGVDNLFPIPLTPNQYGALASFGFNCGLANLRISTLRKKVLAGQHGEAAAQFNRWIYARGIKLNGLIRRRRAEAELYLRS